jgi:hypothetical protein
LGEGRGEGDVLPLPWERAGVRVTFSLSLGRGPG